jgi:predicted tellurium resistance membrane protein TerC
VILGFVGLKFIIEGIGEQTHNEALHIPTWASLAFIAVVLGLTFWLSLRHDRRQQAAEEEDAVDSPS